MRGIAALGVVLHHYTWRFGTLYPGESATPVRMSWGFYGVYLFFLISGYVIFMSLTRTRRPMDFVVSRFSRLYPAYWAAVVLTFVVVRLVGLPGLEVSLPDGVVNLTMLQKYLLLPEVDRVYWTLAVELAFYAIVFALYWGGMLSARRLPLTLWIWLALGVAWRLFLTAGPQVPGVEYVGLHLLILPYAQFFVAGMCLFEIHRSGKASSSLVLLVAAAPLVQYIQSPIQAIPVSAFQSAVVAVFLIAVFIATVEGRLPWLSSRPLLELGAISYTLYLVHMNIGYVMLRWFSARHVDPTIAVVVALIVIVSLAVLITRTIEQPAMRLMRGWYRRHRERSDLPA